MTTASPAVEAEAPPPWHRARRLAPAGVYAFLAVVVLAFSGAWAGGELMLDGPGISLWVRVLLDHWDAGHGIPAWIPDMWAGTPAWDLFASFPLLILLPLGAVVGPETAVKLGVVGAQIFGAWGAYVFARSLWGQTWPALAAGIVYGIHPFFVSHGVLFGQEPTVWVFAATPWIAWSLRLALRRAGARYVALAGLFIALALVQQAEHAYSLLLLCGVLLVVELAQARHAATGARRPVGVLVRAGAVVVIAFGAVAYWLLPLMARSRSFVLTPRDEVEAVLEYLSGALSRRPGTFLDRADELSGTFDFFRVYADVGDWQGAVGSSLYLGSVCVVLTLVTVVWSARRRQADSTVNAMLVASILGIWMSMGPISLASGGLASLGGVVPLIAIGLLAGLLMGTFLRALQLQRAAFPCAVAMALFFFVASYLTPLSSLVGVLPLLSSIRVYRLYPLAALGVALGTAYPLALAQSWAASRRPDVAPVLGAALSLAVAGLFVVDVFPFTSYYDLERPDGRAAYREMARRLDGPDDLRLATDFYGNPQTTEALLATGRQLSVGWPHPLASKNLWRLTTEVMGGNTPNGFRDGALGLSSTGYLATEKVSKRDDLPRTVDEVKLEANPRALPLVRAYESNVVLPDGELTPELAVALSGRNVGVVAGGPAAVEALGAAATGAVTSTRPCEPGGLEADGPLAAEVAMACAMHNWVGVRLGRSSVTVTSPVGGTFEASSDGLRGISVWLDRVPGVTELTLREEPSEEQPSGRVVARTTASDLDDNTMARFTFDRVARSAGRRYSFLLTCPRCTPGEEPSLVVTNQPRRAGNLVMGDRVDGDRASAFTPIYDQLAAAEPPRTELHAVRPGPGKWRIQVSGPQPSLVVAAETWFPGWTAKVDGKKVEVLEADGAFLGVPVGSGSHEITLEYRRTNAALLGRVLTLLTLLACLPLLRAANVGGRRVAPATRGRPAGRRTPAPARPRRRSPRRGRTRSGAAAGR